MNAPQHELDQLHQKTELAVQQFAALCREAAIGEFVNSMDQHHARATAVVASMIYAYSNQEPASSQDYFMGIMEHNSLQMKREYSRREWANIGRIAWSSIQCSHSF